MVIIELGLRKGVIVSRFSHLFSKDSEILEKSMNLLANRHLFFESLHAHPKVRIKQYFLIGNLKARTRISRKVGVNSLT